MLNVYLAWVFVCTLCLSVFLQVPPPIALPLALVIPTWAWFKRRLLPTTVADGHAARLLRGQRLTAIANVLVGVGVLLPLFLGSFAQREELYFLSILGGFSLFASVPLWIAGLWSIYGGSAAQGTQGMEASNGTDATSRRVSWKRVATLLVGALGLMVVAWYVAPLLGQERWAEEVRLSDGSILTVHRAVQYERLGELGVGMTMVHLQERVRFVDPSTGDAVVWRQPKQIAVFVDRIDGRFWIVGRNTRLTKNDMRIFQAYLYDGSGWIATEPEQAPPVSRPNLAIDAVVHDRSKRWKFLSLQNKDELDATSGVDAVYRSIDLRRTL